MHVLSGDEAIYRLVHSGGFIALVTDVRLGRGPDGWEVARYARSLVPGLPVVYASADSSSTWASQGVPNSIMLEKPFVIADLVTSVSALIDDQVPLPPLPRSA